MDRGRLRGDPGCLLRPGAVANQTARVLAVPNPTGGQSVWRVDKWYREVYLTSPAVSVSSWFPIEDFMPAARLGRSATYARQTSGYGLSWDSVKRNARSAMTRRTVNCSYFNVKDSGD